MFWNPFKKRIIKKNANDQLLVQQLEFTNKIKSIMTKYEKIITKYQGVVEVMNAENNKLYQALQTLTNPPAATTPIFLDESKSAYKPRVRIAAKEKDVTISMDPRHIYTTSPLITKIVADKKWELLYLADKQACAMSIWDYVIKVAKYQYDKSEDWRYSTLSIYYKWMDCEDGTIMFLDLCREAGFRADEVFNAVGYVTATNGDTFCHSYPILNYGEGWFIYESTLDTTPRRPKKFFGSNYDAKLGISNWATSGKLKGNKTQI